MLFIDRIDAGLRLAERLEDYRAREPVILGLVRGGVPVAFAVAITLDAPLDFIVVRKLGVPSQPELGMGAISEDGVRIINEEVIRMTEVTPNHLASVEKLERAALERRTLRFRRNRPRVPLAGRTVLVVDDGVATGSTARAACRTARLRGATQVVFAVPVAAANAIDALHQDADTVICIETPQSFTSVGEWYENFTQTSDEEVIALLRRANDRNKPNSALAVPPSW